MPGAPYSITLADIVRISKSGLPDYNGLQFKVEKRYANGVTFIGSYGYSRTIGLATIPTVCRIPWIPKRIAQCPPLT